MSPDEANSNQGYKGDFTATLAVNPNRQVKFMSAGFFLADDQFPKLHLQY